MYNKILISLFISYLLQYVHGNQLDQSDHLEVEALGRVAELGWLYNAQNDQFLSVSLFAKHLTNQSRSIIENAETKISFTMTNTFEEKFKSLDISANLQLSVLFGLAKLEGSGKYFERTKSSAKSAIATLIQSVSTYSEQCNLATDEIKQAINYDVLSDVKATHVVVGIQWGGKVLVSVEDINRDSLDTKTINGALQAEIELVAGKISGGASVQFDEGELHKINSYRFEVFGDILPEKVPNTVVDALKIMRDSTALIRKSNNGKGKALKYTMVPLNLVRTILKTQLHAHSMITQLDEATIKSCVRFFDEMTKVALQINDMVNEVEKYELFLADQLIMRLKDLKADYESYQAKAREFISYNFIQVRSGKVSPTVLNKVLVYLTNMPNSHYNIDMSLFKSIRMEIGYVDRLKQWNVTLIDKIKDVSLFLSDNHANSVFIFFYENFVEENDVMKTFRIIQKHETYLGKKVIIAAMRNTLYDPVGGENLSNKINLYVNASLFIDNFVIEQDNHMNIYNDFWGYQMLNKTIVDLRDSMNTEIANVKQEIESVRVYFKSSLDTAIDTLRKEMNDLKVDGETGLSSGLTRLNNEINQLKTESRTNREGLNREATNLRQEIQRVNSDFKSNHDSLVGRIKSENLPQGFIYVQYPFQSAPSSIWPQFKWIDVTDQYSGRFFRASGGAADCWECKQGDHAPRLISVRHHEEVNGEPNTIDLTPGQWSRNIRSGEPGGSGDWDSMQFLVSAGEVRPQNYAIRIWKRG